MMRKESQDQHRRSSMRLSWAIATLAIPNHYIAKIENDDSRVDSIKTIQLCKVVEIDPLLLVDMLT
jgi:hypothetical protein